MKYRALTFTFLFSSILLMSCGKNIDQARESINGTWSVTSAFTSSGSFTGTTFFADTDNRETGNLGSFEFTDTQVAYEFTRQDTSYVGDDTWVLSSERVNSGFTKVTKYTLTIENKFLFDVLFEDGTKDSQDDANSITLTQQATPDYPVFIILDLEKN